MRLEMAVDPFYKRCCLTGARSVYPNRLQWHHHFIFAGKRVNEKWCIVPLTDTMHDRVREPEIKNKLDKIVLNRATDEELKKYSKVEDLIAKRERLNNEKESI